VLKLGKLTWLTKAEKTAVENAPKIGAPCSKLASTGISNDGVKLTCGKSGTTKKWMTADDYNKSLESPTPTPSVTPPKNSGGAAKE
jgi:hypothetical protein